MKAKFVIFFACLAAAALIFIVGLGYMFAPVDAAATDTISFVVPRGQPVAQIGQRLADEGLVRHPLVFRLAVKQLGLDQKLQAGGFKVSPSMTPQQLATTLTQGTEDTWVTILEGWRREEIAEYLAGQELGEFNASEFLAESEGLEGKLFPDTYLIPQEITAASMVQLLERTFEAKVTQGLAAEISAYQTKTNRSLSEILVMASLVQREARTYEQMRHVAGILWNRIDLNMALQVDATLQYVKGYNKAEKDWWSTPLAADKSLVSAYNTYLNPGLPPAPIANPGIDAIKATVMPLEVNDLFYIHAPDGTMYYAQTVEQHNANVNQYLR